MSQQPDGQTVLVQHPVTLEWELAYFKYANGKWWKGVEYHSDDIELDYTPVQWKWNWE